VSEGVIEAGEREEEMVTLKKSEYEEILDALRRARDLLSRR
jgi:hypothetical protein